MKKLKYLYISLIIFYSNFAFSDSELFKAAQSGDNEKILQLLKAGEDVNALDKLEWTPLFDAISWGKTKTVELLIKNKATINISNNEGNTPLHMAIFLGHVDIVKILIAKEANINAINHNGQMPLHFAAGGKIEIVNFLLSNGALQVKDKFGRKPIEHATSDAIKKVLQK